jgi:hypothetical protein
MTHQDKNNSNNKQLTMLSIILCNCLRIKHGLDLDQSTPMLRLDASMRQPPQAENDDGDGNRHGEVYPKMRGNNGLSCPRLPIEHGHAEE